MGSAMAVVKWMHRENIELPAGPRSGPANGELRWALPRVPQVTRILRNPRYAGAFVYGRTHVERRADGTGRYRVVPMEDWHVCIPDAHAIAASAMGSSRLTDEGDGGQLRLRLATGGMASSRDMKKGRRAKRRPVGEEGMWGMLRI